MTPKFEYVSPDQIQVGDIVVCYRHDDQHEQANARVERVEIDKTPGIFGSGQYQFRYEYRVWLTCRHISLNRLDAAGGPEYRWHLASWNGVTRYKLSSIGSLTKASSHSL